MNIDDMPAGPELDRLIAEKVMGWRMHPRNTAHYVREEPKDEYSNYVPQWISEWKPSTNIAQAMEAIALPLDNDWRFIIRLSDNAVDVEFRSRAPDVSERPTMETRGDTLALALCRAMLIARESVSWR